MPWTTPSTVIVQCRTRGRLSKARCDTLMRLLTVFGGVSVGVCYGWVKHPVVPWFENSNELSFWQSTAQFSAAAPDSNAHSSPVPAIIAGRVPATTEYGRQNK